MNLELFSNMDPSKSGNSSISSSLSPATSLVNIQRVNDPFARYKMPRLEVRTKAKGQYSDTYIANLYEVAAALKVQCKWIVRFMAYDLSSLIKEDGDHWTIKGTFGPPALEESLRKFIDKYVLCPQCDLPELDYSGSGRGKKVRLQIKCRGCGWNNSYDPAKDRLHKVMLGNLLPEAKRRDKD